MLVTILEARVEPEKWAALESEHRAANRHMPPQLLESVLLQSAEDPMLWRALSLWRSHEALEEYRHSVETPKGVEMFRQAGAEPHLTEFEVVARTWRQEG